MTDDLFKFVQYGIITWKVLPHSNYSSSDGFKIFLVSVYGGKDINLVLDRIVTLVVGNISTVTRSRNQLHFQGTQKKEKQSWALEVATNFLTLWNNWLQDDNIIYLKKLDTIGIVKDQSSHLLYLKLRHMQKITNLYKFELNRSSKLGDNNERKNTLVTWSCSLSDAWFWDLKFYIWGLEIKFNENYFFLENYVISEGAVSHNVLH